jgi:hypothetical protein
MRNELHKHLRQIRTPRAALVAHVVDAFLGAGGGEFIEPIDDLGIAATLIDETRDTNRRARTGRNSHVTRRARPLEGVVSNGSTLGCSPNEPKYHEC